ncbi:MAG TPA: hypothetical protein VNO50_10735 [Pyrinomonadaceae bacterium]|nr:hypothetical protein [Pyrinomonadaceae bacterium]
MASSSKTEKSYNTKKARRLAMIPEDIKKLITETPRKPRNTPAPPETLEEALETPDLIIYMVNVPKPPNSPHATEWKYFSPPMSAGNWILIESAIQDILLFIQKLVVAQCYHPEDIKLFYEAATKHFL